MTTRKWAFLVAVIFGIFVLTLMLVLGPRPISPSTTRAGDSALSWRLTELAEPGHHQLTAVTIANGQPTYAGLGMDENTEVEIGSVTKTFTAEVLRNQIATGRVSEDTAVGEIIDAGETHVADVTLRELADHTSGLPRLDNSNWFRSIVSGFTGGNPYQGSSAQGVVERSLEMSLSGRGEETYSNFGFALLGQLLATEANTTYEQLVQEQILDPLGMSDTYLMDYGAVTDDAPRGHLLSGRNAEPWEMGGHNPAGGIRSTSADMARFAQHLLEKGVPEFTWVTQEDGSSWHNGGTFGYSTMLILDPATGHAAFTSGDTMAGVEELTTHLFDEVS